MQAHFLAHACESRRDRAWGILSVADKSPCRDIFALLPGGIAQLVERLVRNEKARGSNPLTSKAAGVEVKSARWGHYGCTSGSVIPLPPVFARVVEESEDCRAGDSAKVGLSLFRNLNAWLKEPRADSPGRNFSVAE